MREAEGQNVFVCVCIMNKKRWREKSILLDEVLCLTKEVKLSNLLNSFIHPKKMSHIWRNKLLGLNCLASASSHVLAWRKPVPGSSVSAVLSLASVHLNHPLAQTSDEKCSPRRKWTGGRGGRSLIIALITHNQKRLDKSLAVMQGPFFFNLSKVQGVSKGLQDDHLLLEVPSLILVFELFSKHEVLKCTINTNQKRIYYFNLQIINLCFSKYIIRLDKTVKNTFGPMDTELEPWYNRKLSLFIHQHLFLHC